MKNIESRVKESSGSKIVKNVIGRPHPVMIVKKGKVLINER